MPDEVIYLNPDINKCMERVADYKDGEGKEIFTRTYLETCHSLHHGEEMKRNNTFSEIDAHPDDIAAKLAEIEKIIARAESIEIEVILPCPPDKPKMISIEGNIGAGKSSLLRAVRKRLEHEDRKDIILLEEPIEEWKKVTDGFNNIIQLFYHAPQLYAYTFQTLVAITTMRALHKALSDNPDAKVVLCERSLFSSRQVFAEALYEDGSMNDIEMGVYNQLFNDDVITWMYPEEMIYIKVQPESCLQRVKLRDRKGEGNIDIEWLREYQGYYEKALFEDMGKLPRIIEGESTNEKIRDSWVDQVVEWCEVVGGIPLQNTPINEGTRGESDIYVDQPKEGGIPTGGEYTRMPIKVRLGESIRYIGSRGDTLDQLKLNIRQHLSGLNESLILLAWRPS